MRIIPIENNDYYYEHLTSRYKNLEDIKTFTVAKQSGKGLERFLKESAVQDEENHANRTYLVRNKKTDEIAGYFSLRNNSFVINTGTEGEKSLYTLSSIELSNFAVNSVYRARHPELPKIGQMMFTRFILPIAHYLADFIGIQALHIYALPEDDLVNYYAALGFSSLPQEMEAYIHEHIKPAYDEDCVFMYQLL